MKTLNRRLPSVPAHQFSMVARPDVPRSTFASTSTYKTTLDADNLVPIYLEEVLPGDSFKGSGQVFLRMSTPIFPVMDNVHLDAFFFFIPNRLVWDNWRKFMGEQKDPTSSTDYLVPQAIVNATYNTLGSLFDYFGLPTPQQIPTDYQVNALPFRGYLLVWNEWFRDENMQNSAGIPLGDGPDVAGFYSVPYKRGKRHDYFTSCLPWPQKGPAVNIPLLGEAPVGGIGFIQPGVNATVGGLQFHDALGTALWPSTDTIRYADQASNIAMQVENVGGQMYPKVFADLSQATGATINAMRLAAATQQLLERDARGGTRYTELLRNHFGVQPQDSRMQRPEYIGGGGLTMQTQAIPQTSGTANDPSTGYSPTPIGSLGGASVGAGGITFQYSATEHGWIMGLVAIRADLTYQQGIHRSFSRRTRYDYYWPAFAFLGEQAVTNREIFALGTANDDLVFGYQERWAEYRYAVSRVTGQFRSGIPGTLDAWHLSEFFESPGPALNNTFIQSNTPMSRVLAAGDLAANQQFLLDSVWHVKATRPIPVRSTPGLTRF